MLRPSAALPPKLAPGFADQIARALATASPNPVGDTLNANGNGNGNGNRPEVPPGQVGKDTNPGTIRGNRPEVPPGQVRDPKPGRDPQRNRYGHP